MRKLPFSHGLGGALAFLAAASVSFAAAQPPKEQLDFFEQKVRPLLSERCYKCHSNAENKSKGGLTLDTRSGWEKGGEHGPALVPGKPGDSLLLKALSYTDDDLQMPPKKEGGKLSDAQIDVFKQWIASGAADPREGGAKRLTGMTPEARAHWAFKPVQKPSIPPVKDSSWAKTDLDSFVLAKLEANGMKPSQQASKEALIRRANYDLIGLPPTLDEVNAFLADASTNAFEKVIDRLLASPHYGERWARHWLDSARYSDTTGHNGDGGGRFRDYRYPYAWTYRDYVVQAINDDKPYNEFLIEQLAADHLPDIKTNDSRLAALGFITVGKRFDNPDDQIDERIDATGKAMLGLTVSCARCHDHKFDPIPAADYYSLHSIFASTHEPLDLPEIPGTGDPGQREDFEHKLAALESKNRDYFYAIVRRRIGEFQAKAEGYLMLVAQKPRSVERSDIAREYGLTPEEPEIINALRLNPEHPVLGPFARLAKIPAADFPAKAPEVLKRALADKKNPVNPVVAGALDRMEPKNLAEVAHIYGQIFSRAAQSTTNLLHVRCREADQSLFSDTQLAEIIETPYKVPAEREIENTELLIAYLTGKTPRKPWETPPPFEQRTADGFAFTAINELRLTHPGSPGRAMVAVDRPKPVDSYVHIRGDRNKRGPATPRQFLEILSGPNRKPFTHGSGRLELAKAIADPANPMTARVAVNRVWMHHIGDGIVKTPDDMGNMSEKPSNQELLDYMAARFVEDGWSLKKLHKLIMLSAVYQQASDNNPAYEARDPGNRLVWRANLRRLDFEAIRDSLVLLTGEMDASLGGKPVNLTDEPYSYRRSIYGYVDRLRLSDLLTQFDFSDPEMPNTRRVSTIVPQQALFFMNSPMAVDVARHVMERTEVEQATDDDGRISAIYRILFQRKPQAREILWAREFIQRGEGLHGHLTVAAQPAAKAPNNKKKDMAKNKYAVIQNEGRKVARSSLNVWELYAQALLCSNEFVYVY